MVNTSNVPIELVLYTFDVSWEQFYEDSKNDSLIYNDESTCSTADCCNETDSSNIFISDNNGSSKDFKKTFSRRLFPKKVSIFANKIGNFMKKFGSHLKLKRKKVNFELPSPIPEVDTPYSEENELPTQASKISDTESLAADERTCIHHSGNEDLNHSDKFRIQGDAIEPHKFDPTLSAPHVPKNDDRPVDNVKINFKQLNKTFKSPTEELIDIICGEGVKCDGNNIDKWIQHRLSIQNKSNTNTEAIKITKNSRQVKLRNLVQRIKENQLPRFQSSRNHRNHRHDDDIVYVECADNTTIQETFSQSGNDVAVDNGSNPIETEEKDRKQKYADKEMQHKNIQNHSLNTNYNGRSLEKKKWKKETETNKRQLMNNLFASKETSNSNRRTPMKKRKPRRKGQKNKTTKNIGSSSKSKSESMTSGRKRSSSRDEVKSSSKKSNSSRKLSDSMASISSIKSCVSMNKDDKVTRDENDLSKLTAARECSTLMNTVCTTGLERSKFDYASRILTKRHAEGCKSAKLGLDALHSTLPQSIYVEENQPMKSNCREYHEDSFLVRMISGQAEQNRMLYKEVGKENLSQNEGDPNAGELTKAIYKHNVNDRDMHLDLVHTLRATTGGAMYSSSRLQEIYLNDIHNTMDEQMRREKLRTIKDVSPDVKAHDSYLPLHDDNVEPDDPFIVRLSKQNAVTTNAEKCLKTGEVIRKIADQPNAMGSKLTYTSVEGVNKKVDSSIASLEPGIQTGSSIPTRAEKTRFYWVPQDYREFLRASDHPIASEYFPQEEGPPEYQHRYDDLLKTNPKDVNVQPKFCGILVREFFHVNLYLRLHPQTSRSYYVMYNVMLWGRDSEPVAHHRTPVPIPFLPGTAHHIASLSDTAIMDVLTQNYMVVVFYLTYYTRNIADGAPKKKLAHEWEEFNVCRQRINELKHYAPPPRLSESINKNALHDLSPFWYIPIIHPDAECKNASRDNKMNDCRQDKLKQCENISSQISGQDEEIDMLLETSRELGFPLLGTEEFEEGGPTALCHKCKKHGCFPQNALIGKPLCYNCQHVGCTVIT